jgi:hypothetical protein
MPRNVIDVEEDYHAIFYHDARLLGYFFEPHAFGCVASRSQYLEFEYLTKERLFPRGLSL